MGCAFPSWMYEGMSILREVTAELRRVYLKKPDRESAVGGFESHARTIRILTYLLPYSMNGRVAMKTPYASPISPTG